MFKKTISALIVLTLVMELFTPMALNQVKAQGEKEGNIIRIDLDEEGNPTEKSVNELADMIEFIYEDAAILDSDGSIINIDVEKIISKYGDSYELRMLDNMIKHGNKYSRNRVGGSFTDCMIEAIKDYFGVGIIGMLGSGIYALIKKKAWKTVAKMILKVLVKSAAKYFTVAGIVATLVYYAGKCALTSQSGIRYNCFAYINQDCAVPIRI